MDFPAFSRTPMGGQRSSEVKARVADETKFALQRRCAELGLNESDYIDQLLCVSLFGFDAVLAAELERMKKVAGMWRKPDSN